MAADTDLASPWASTVPGAPPQRQFAPPVDLPPRSALGGWGRRVAATLTDSALLLLALAPVLALAALATPVSDALTYVVLVVGYIAVIAFGIAQLVRQGRRGATWGKQLVGLRLVNERTGQPIGVALSLVRPFAHMLDALPLYVGYLWPLFDRKRQTFCDKAMSTLVLRVPRRALPWPVAGLALALAALMTTGSLVALADWAPDLDDPPATAADRSRTPATPAPPVVPPPAPPAPPPLGPLPAEDTAGRIAPAAPGYTAVSDEVSELGSLDATETAALAGGTPEEISLTAKEFLSLGFVGAYGRGFDSPDNAYVVLAYRFSTNDGATRFMDELRSLYDTGTPTAVPGGVLSGPIEESNTLSGYLSQGAYVYEVSIFGADGSFGFPELDALLVRQYEHAQITG